MRHHDVPKFYLKNWETEFGIFCFYYEHHKFLMVNKKSSEVGFLPDLNSFKTIDGTLDHKIESDFLSFLDNSSANVLQKILNLGISNIDSKKQEIWCDFILGLISRHPYVLNEARSIIKSSIKEFEKQLNPILIESEEYKHFHDNYHIENMKNDIQKQHSSLKSLLLKLNWFQLDLKSSKFNLLTGDMPLSLYSLSEKKSHRLMT